MTKRLLALALVLVFAAVACGGRTGAPESDDQGLAALEEDGASPEPDAAGDEGEAGDPMDSPDDPVSDKNDPNPPAGTGAGDAGGGSRPSSGGAAPGAPAQAATAVPQGTYAYDTDGTVTVSGGSRGMPKRTTLTADALKGEEQRQIRDLRDSDGNGTVTESRLLYRSDGVYLTYVKVTATFPGGLTDVRELRPPQPALIAPAGAGPGFKTSFYLEGSGTRADVTVNALRNEKLAVGGENVGTVVVATDIVFSGAIEGKQESTSWIWPKHVMALKEQVHTDLQNGPIEFQSDYEALIERLP